MQRPTIPDKQEKCPATMQMVMLPNAARLRRFNNNTQRSQVILVLHGRHDGHPKMLENEYEKSRHNAAVQQKCNKNK